MRIIVTGASGFLGQAVLPLLAGHDVVATDLMLSPGVIGVPGDIADPQLQAALFADGCDAVLHLASMPGAAVAANPARGWQVNLHAAHDLAAQAARAGNRPRFVFASSIAVLGELPPDRSVDDATPLAPVSDYGALKAMAECWLARQHRTGALSVISLRLPGLVARPGAGEGFGSAFLSTMFGAIAAGRHVELPVSAAATPWLMSVRIAADNMVHALGVPDLTLPDIRALTLPALRPRMAELVAAIAAHAGTQPQVHYNRQAAVEQAFAAYPPLCSQAAIAAGFRSDETLAALVAHAMELS
ncbi:NAD-dependent epimerase/dehydratase family protein [Novosphingobium sp.]|uniref:NAD-dependent epimerase/dehydratase family protein n=1 Tax=Novosphingobium sp. TaxID=1874826 RepID=UPI002733CCE5|nr:NAD-dependent epimerase/dehydratase family protein [Novosphingobium sp.]MDP3908644.1 NAD-dependent epimerase/dehydratase family protein [Novosphingobium sp.]